MGPTRCARPSIRLLLTAPRSSWSRTAAPDLPPLRFWTEIPPRLRIIYVDSGPSADGSAFDASESPETEEAPLPPFEQLPASLDGLSETDLKRFCEPAVPEPGSITREPVRLTNDSRRDVPFTIIACSP